MTFPAARAGSSRVAILSLGKVADQGSLFVGSILVARAVGPAAFAPLGALLIVNSLSVQLSDLGLGFAVHGSPLGTPLPGRSLRMMRTVGLAAMVVTAAVALLLGNALVALAGATWALSGDAYLRKATMIRAQRPIRVLVAEAIGGAGFLVLAMAGAAAEVPELMGVGLVAKHLIECLAAPLQGAINRHGKLASHQEWFGQIATFGASNADYVAVLLLLPSAAFSVYVLAFRAVNALPSLVAQALTQHTFVELAGASGDLDETGLMSRVRRRVALLSVGGAAAGVSAAWLGRLVLGDEWSELVLVSALLAVAVPARLLLGPSVALAISRGRARVVIDVELLRLVLTAGTTAIGSRWGIAGCAIGATTGTSIGVALLHWRAGSLTRQMASTRSYRAHSQ